MIGYFFVPGKPEPQGSTKAFPVRRKDGKVGVRVVSDNDDLKPWRDSIGAKARETLPHGERHRILFPRPEPVMLHVMFVLPRRASEPKRTAPHTRKPDVDKLLRGVLDALTGVLYEDDSQVTDIGHLGKRVAAHGESPGVHVTWMSLDEGIVDDHVLEA